jgi:hypothetical protein
MNRIITTVAAATATIGVACALPASASANPVILAPAIAALWLGGAVVGGVAVGAIISHPRGGVLVTSDVPPPASAPGPDEGPAPAPGPVASAAPDQHPGCYPSRAKIHGVWHDIQICD